MVEGVASSAYATGAGARSAHHDPLSFLPGVAEQLGYYVYALFDPRDNALFYVGKGVVGRVFQHAREARTVDGESSAGNVSDQRPTGSHVDIDTFMRASVRHHSTHAAIGRPGLQMKGPVLPSFPPRNGRGRFGTSLQERRSAKPAALRSRFLWGNAR